jgi:hypothetical protein
LIADMRALCRAEGLSLEDVEAEAKDKRDRAGGFEEGLVLLQTGILGKNRSGLQEADRARTQVLARKVSNDTYEIPFSFFGFMELDQPRSLVFEDFGVRLDVVLKGDRIELHVSKEAQQLQLPLDRTVSPDADETALRGLPKRKQPHRRRQRRKH